MILITLVIYLLQLLPGIGTAVTSALLYAPQYSVPQSGYPFEPWRLITVAFVHSPQQILHIAFNMLALWMFGQQLETMLGKGRFVALYLISALGGSVAVLYLGNGPVVGASGAIFGLLGAFFILVRKLGGKATGLLIVIGLNLAVGFFVGSISWQAHVGGLIAGVLVGLIYVQTRHRRLRPAQIGLLVGLAVVLFIAGIWPALFA
ncbi:rhomboid family intramembrane serine protease [Amnibacterium flavum]|uniref:Rhomboid family intramembrane serine protease n=1 Tax=Amnibacterium flavum TaxID=2173173 RepID=A0A2V1HWM8_9MICO|nr:rhomboid family intramembrane serine protease [Amnibacterium flavum]